MSSFVTAAQLAAGPLAYAVPRVAGGIPLSQAFAPQLDPQKRRSRGLRNLKRPFPFVIPAENRKVLKLTAPGPPRNRKPMFLKRRRRPVRARRRFRRSFKRRKRTFRRRTRRGSSRRPQTRKIVLRSVSNVLKPTDASAPNILVLAPFSYGYTQGVGANQFTGDTIFIRGVRMRIQFRMATPGTTVNDVRWRMFMVKHRSNMAVGQAGTILNSTTTDTANPGAAGNQDNLHVFDSILSAWSPFVGDDITTPFDTTNCTIMKMYHGVLKSQGTTGAEPSRLVDYWFPINERWKIEDIAEANLTAPYFGKTHTFYIYLQCYDGIGAIDNTNRLGFDYVSTAYWYDIP